MLVDDYKKNKEKYNELTRKYGNNISNGCTAHISIKYISDKVGSGVYANQDFSKGAWIGECMSKVMNATKSSSVHRWSYPSGDTNSKEKYYLAS